MDAIATRNVNPKNLIAYSREGNMRAGRMFDRAIDRDAIANDAPPPPPPESRRFDTKV